MVKRGTLRTWTTTGGAKPGQFVTTCDGCGKEVWRGLWSGAWTTRAEAMKAHRCG